MGDLWKKAKELKKQKETADNQSVSESSSDLQEQQIQEETETAEAETVSCGICSKPVKVSEAKSDNGTPVHDECLTSKTKKETSEETSTKKINFFGKKVSEVPTSAVTETISQPITPIEPKRPVPTVIPVSHQKTSPNLSSEFDLSPDTGSTGKSMMVYGNKGDGKTTLPLSAEGSFAVICLDQQSKIIIEEFPPFADKDAIVYDAVRYYNTIDPEAKLESADKTVRYIHALLEGPIKEQHPDWIMIDGTEILSHICEMRMRYNNNLQPFEGIRNLNVWKERNMYLDQIHMAATRVAKKGVIYTAYCQIKEITDAVGTKKREQPKWAGDIQYKTRVVIKVESASTKDGRVFYATVESSKIAAIPTGGRKVVGTIDKDGEIDFMGLQALTKGEF